MEAFLDRAQTIKDRYYGGDISRDAAFKSISALCCEMLVLEKGAPRELRALRAAALTVQFLEPAV